jgi:hypothetical protein
MQHEDKIYCANCQHCIVIKLPVSDKADSFLLRLKCSKGVWQKKLGTEKLYKYFTAARRAMEKCEFYVEMGDVLPYIKSLRKTLPAQDEFYREGRVPGVAQDGSGTAVEVNIDDDNED